MKPEKIRKLVDEADRLCDLGQYAEAYRLDARAAEAGDPRALTHMGWYCENGLGTDADPVRAFEYYSRAAAAGFAPAVYCQAMCYRDGVGTAVDIDCAVDMLHKAADMGVDDANEALDAMAPVEGIALTRLSDDVRRMYAKEEYAQLILPAWIAAASGDASSAYILGLCYLDGKGLKANREKAVEYLTAAADSRFVPAMVRLAEITVKDERTRAAELLQYAYDNGNMHAAYLLGKYVKDQAEAQKFLEEAAAGGDIDAMAELGITYHRIDYLDCAARSGHIASIHEIAKYYYNVVKEGEKQNIDLAVHWLKESASHGSTYSRICLANYNLEGLGMPKDPKTAMSIFLDLYNEHGMKGAAYMLGYLYELGYSEEGPYSPKAITWYERAGDYKDAKGRMEHVQRELEREKEKAEKKRAEEQQKERRKQAEEYLVAGQWKELAQIAKKDADDGDRRMQYLYARALFGLNGDKDEISKYLMAAEAGEVEAREWLAELAWNGKLGMDRADAFRWAKKVIDNCSHSYQPVMLFYVGWGYFNGLGTEQKYADASWYFARFLNTYSTAPLHLEGLLGLAANCVGIMYYKGLGNVIVDYLEAEKLFDMAIRFGYTRALVHKAMCYDNGERRDMNKAISLYRQAAEAGDERAIKRLRELGK